MKAINTRYANRFFRSRVEARWAVLWDALGIPWRYEVEGYELPSGRYLPDFVLSTFHIFVEIKGTFPTAEECQKCAELAVATNRVVLLAAGEPEERFQVRWFDANGEDDRLWVIAKDRDPDGGFWLVGNDDDSSARWFGGGMPGFITRRGPMFSGVMEAAYGLALGMRFEHGEGRTRVAPVPESIDRLRHFRDTGEWRDGWGHRPEERAA